MFHIQLNLPENPDTVHPTPILIHSAVKLPGKLTGERQPGTSAVLPVNKRLGCGSPHRMRAGTTISFRYLGREKSIWHLSLVIWHCIGTWQLTLHLALH